MSRARGTVLVGESQTLLAHPSSVIQLPKLQEHSRIGSIIPQPFQGLKLSKERPTSNLDSEATRVNMALEVEAVPSRSS